MIIVVAIVLAIAITFLLVELLPHTGRWWFKNKVTVSGEKIFEVITESDGLGYGLAIVDITESKRHVHPDNMVEVYTLISGKLMFTIDDREISLTWPGATASIVGGEKHSAKSLVRGSS